MPLTDDQATIAKQLRDQGLSYADIAKKVGISESASWKHLNPKPPKPPKPNPPPPPPPRQLLLPHRLPSSVPITRPIVLADRQRPQMTKQELARDLALAVRNTAMLRRQA
jgi:hypothetical protein